MAFGVLACWVRKWGRGVGTDVKSFSFGNRIDCANIELQNVKEGFEDVEPQIAVCLEVY